MVTKRKKSEKMVDAVVDEGAELAQKLGSYFRADFKNADGRMNHFRDIHWIYENMDMVGVSEASAPSAGAYMWLMDIRNDASGDSRRKFRDYYMKIAPSGKELEEREKLEDDGSSVLELIEAVERCLGGGK